MQSPCLRGPGSCIPCGRPAAPCPRCRNVPTEWLCFPWARAPGFYPPGQDFTFISGQEVLSHMSSASVEPCVHKVTWGFDFSWKIFLPFKPQVDGNLDWQLKFIPPTLRPRWMVLHGEFHVPQLDDGPWLSRQVHVPSPPRMGNTRLLLGLDPEHEALGRWFLLPSKSLLLLWHQRTLLTFLWAC